MIPPPGIPQRGSYVALSDDEGVTWKIKRPALAWCEGKAGDRAFPS